MTHAEECSQPCCVEAREREVAWAEYLSLVRVIVRARTGQRIIGREPFAERKGKWST